MTPFQLGQIGVSLVFADTTDELARVMHEAAATLPLRDEPNGRIVLIMPNALRELLAWPESTAPQVAVFSHDLVFSPPV